MTYHTYHEFERTMLNSNTDLEIVRLCVDNYFVAKEFIARQEWLKLMRNETDSRKELNK